MDSNQLDKSQLKALLRRNFYFKIRVKQITMFEILWPIVFFIIMGVIRQSLTLPDDPIRSHDPSSLNLFTLNKSVYFSPNTTEVQQIASEVCLDLECTETVFATSQEAVNRYTSLASTNAIGVEFLSADLRNYSIRYSQDSYPLQFISTKIDGCLKALNTTTINGCPSYTWYYNGFLSLQRKIDDALLKLANGTYPGSDIQIEMMPELRKFVVDLGLIRWYFPFYTALVYCYVTMYMGGSIAIDKDKKYKDLLTMMGMKPRIYLMAWTLIYVVLIIGVATVGLIIFIVFSFFKSAAMYIFVFICLLIYGLLSMELGLVWSCVFPKPNYMGLIMFVNLVLAAPALLAMTSTSYDDPMNPTQPLAVLSGILCLLPPTCLATIFERLIWYEFLLPDGLSSQAFIAGDLPLVVLFVILVFDVILWWGIAMWFDGIFPTELGDRLSCLFFLKKKYWKPEQPNPEKVQRLIKQYQTGMDQQENVEPASRTLLGHESIRIFDLRKEFTEGGAFSKKKIKAVNGIYLDIYEGQITAILGHNGAGKTTTLNMLTGVTPVTGGVATLYGYDVTNEVDRQAVREMTGVCPQNNVLFDFMSVEEHLRFFAQLKGVPAEEIDRKVANTIELCDLKDKKDSMAKNLSGGQKRKLSVGNAVIGDPKILFLDEPTAGMDPYSRRNLWDFLRQIKKNKTVVLTTHFMDEADILADRKAILSKGKLQCCGSSIYLKNRFGIGYQLDLVVDDVTKQEEITPVIENMIDGAKHKRTYGKEISYNLPIQQTPKFAALFKELESNKISLTMSSYGIAMTTLEEVFLKLGKKEEAKDTEHIQHSGGEIHDGVAELPQEEIDEGVIRSMQPDPSVNRTKQIILSSFKQRIIMIPRSPPTIVFLIFFTIGVIGAVIVACISKPVIYSFGAVPAPIPLNPYVQSLTSIPEGDRAGYQQWMDVPYKNLSTGLLDVFQSNLDEAMSSIYFQTKKSYLYTGLYSNLTVANQMGFDVTKMDVLTAPPEVTIRYNQSYPISHIIAQNLLSQTMLKTITSDAKATITARIQSWPDLSKNTFAISTGAYAAILYSNALFLGTSFIVVELVKERTDRLRTLMRAAGVTVNYYYGVYLGFNIIMLFPILLLAAIIAIAAGAVMLQSAGAAFLFIIHNLIQIISCTVLMICWSFAFNKRETAGMIVTINIFINNLLVIPVMILIALPSTENIGMILHHVFCFVTPYYAWGGGILMLDRIPSRYIAEVNGDINTVVPAGRAFRWDDGMPSALLGGILWSVLLWMFLRIGEVREGQGAVSDVFKCNNNTSSSYNPSNKNKDHIENEDENVVEERQLVETMRENPDARDKVVLMASEIRKEFPKNKPPKTAVRNLSFHVSEGEVFGLLGPNGAGKSSTLNMIIAEYAPTAGQLSVGNIDVHSALSEALNLLGYCPQHDALWEYGTPKEILTFFALCLGMTKDQSHKISEYYIRELKISEHRNNYSKQLSGGTKRKVSFAVAMMGWPSLVLMDEPSTGLDPSSKRFLWDTIQRSFENHHRAAILTTHYMEEADALCTRIGIMVNGELHCIGTSQHLKSKFGSGYQLEVKLKEQEENKMPQLQQLISEKIPGSEILESFSDRIIYSVPQDSMKGPAEVFDMIEAAKEALGIEEYSFSQATLEQVFLGFAKLQLEEGEDIENSNKKKEMRRRSERTMSANRTNPGRTSIVSPPLTSTNL